MVGTGSEMKVLNRCCLIRYPLLADFGVGVANAHHKNKLARSGHRYRSESSSHSHHHRVWRLVVMPMAAAKTKIRMTRNIVSPIRHDDAWADFRHYCAILT